MSLKNTFVNELNLTNSEKQGDIYESLMLKFFTIKTILLSIKKDLFEKVEQDKKSKITTYEESFTRSNFKKFSEFYMTVQLILLKNDHISKKLSLLFRQLQKKNIMTLSYGLTFYTYRSRIVNNKIWVMIFDIILTYNSNLDLKDSSIICDIFIKYTYFYLKKNKFFEIQQLFQAYSSFFSKYGLGTNWTIPNINEIEANFNIEFSVLHLKKGKELQFSIENKKFRTTTQYFAKNPKELNKTKQRNAIFAHIIHSYDSFILYQMLYYANFDCLFIFDSLGISLDSQHDFKLKMIKFYQILIRD
jgi:hypothetical protein